MRVDATSINDYLGKLIWTSVSGMNLAIPLFIKDHGIPMRKPKFSEIHTVDTLDHRDERDVSTHLMFMGAPDILSVSISGWVITPWNGTRWDPRNSSDASIYSTVGNVSHAELIGQLIQGEYTKTATGAVQRRDPDNYYSPYGHDYARPLIATYEWGFTQNPRKQSFSMTLYLEK